MSKKPSWQIAIAVYLVYNLIIYGIWMAVGSDYTDMVGPDVAFQRIFLPLAFGFVFLAGVLSWLGWWPPAMRDEDLAAPRWVGWPIILIASAFILLVLSTTNWSAIAMPHLLVLIGAGLLVGFNEEALTRGILVVGFRAGGHGEAWVWFTTSLLFGLLHLPNALFGLPLFAAVLQVGFAFVMGSGFYVLRRLSGTLAVPMVIHGLWDFATFSHQASGAGEAALKTPLQMGTDGSAIFCTAIMLWVMRDRSTVGEV